MGETTLQQALHDYATIYMPYRNFAERTRAEYRNDLKGLLNYLVSLGVGQVSALALPAIQRYMAQLEEKGFASLTRKRKAVAIRSFLSFLYQDGYMQHNIAGRLVIPFAESTVPRVLTRTECQRLEAASHSHPRDFALIELVLHAGLRLSELANLKLDDLDLGEREGAIRVSAHHATKERTLPLNARACSALSRYLLARPKGCHGAAFINRFGQPLGNRGIQKVIREYLHTAGIRGASVHTLRHTFAAQRAERGGSLKELQQVLGHRDRRSTSIYASFVRSR